LVILPAVITPDNRQDRSFSDDAGKRCPWCRGRLVFTPRFPVREMIPGEPRDFREHDVPEALRTVAAWVCGTALCRYREPA
jgi:hypothetical protein